MSLPKKIFIILIAVSVFLFPQFFRAYWVPTGAMEPTLLGQKNDILTQQITRSGDRILLKKIPFQIGKFKRGDIIVFKFPDKNPNNPPRDFVKRLIGFPGDQIKLSGGSLIINGQKINEPYISEPAIMDYETTVPPNCLFVLGDNRNNSADSRNWGFVPFENVKGLPFIIYYPFSRLGFIPEFPIVLNKNEK